MQTNLARLVLLCVAISAAFGAPAVDPVIPQQLIARLHPGANVTEIATAYNLAIVPGRAIASRGIYLFDILTPGQDPVQLATAVQSDARVQWAEANYFGDTPEGSARSFYFNQVNIPDFFYDQPAFMQVGLEGAALSQPSASGQTVAIIDTGLDVLHPQVAGKTAPGTNLVELNDNVAEVPTGADADGDGVADEMLGHGTHVASLVAWVADGSTILPVRAFDNEGNGDNYVLAQSIFWAIDHGATIINISAGSTYHNHVIEDAIDEAAARGIPIIAAAGNMNVQDPPEFPAMDSDAIAVAAVDELDVRASFSNYHPEVDISAPGVEIYGALPDSEYAAWDGTSFGTPMVSGVAAMIMARHPEWGPSEYRVDNVRTTLRDSAFNIDALNPGFSGLLGGGRLDATAAVRIPPRFTSTSQLPAGAGPASLATADFNRDGNMDYVVANVNAGNVSIAFGNGAGNFQPGPVLSIGQEIEELVAAHFNNDDAPDLAVALDEESILVCYNDGAGLFPNALPVNIGAEASALAAGDMNNDGRIDMIVATRDAGDSVRVVLNIADETFAPQPWTPVGRRPVDVAVARLNADTFLDVVTANRDADSVTVLMGAGNGSLMPGVAYPSGGSDPRAVVASDFDGDGAADLVIGANDGRNVTIRWNNGAGQFNGAVTTKPMNGGRGVESMSFADVSCDGRPDLLIASGDAPEGYIGILLNRASRNPFGPLDWAAGMQTEAVASADFDGDGIPDLVGANELSNNVSLLLNRSCADVGDMNCDGLITVSDIAGLVLSLTDPAGYAAAYPSCRARNADVNGDGLTTVGDIGPFVNLLLGN